MSPQPRHVNRDESPTATIVKGKVVRTSDTGPFDDLISLKNLRAKIPAHLFERSLFWGLVVTFRQILFCAMAAYAQWLVVNSALWNQLHWSIVAVLDLILIGIVGTVYTGAWTLAHECGHGGTTPYTIVNDTIGFIVHTALLVPYFPWQQSHAQHHSRNHHIEQGESHRPNQVKPRKSSKRGGLFWMLKKHVIHPLVFVISLAIGWRLYLIFGLTGATHRPDGKKIKRHSHHLPTDMFPGNYPAWKFWMSNIALVVPLYFWHEFYQTFGWLDTLRVLLGPQLVVDAWLNAITKAQHSHPKLKYMDHSVWSWYRGAIQTVDYSYGWIIDHLHQNIGSAHVAHHIWPRAPAYNGPTITKYLQANLGKYYVRPKKGGCTTIFENGYNKVTEESDAHGFFDWVGLSNPEEY